MRFKETRLIVDDFINRTKTIRRASSGAAPRLFVILRGLPCSGKTAFAKELGEYAMQQHLATAVYSTVTSGSETCVDRCAAALFGLADRNADIVVVNECNLQPWEYSMYVRLHQAPNYLASVHFKCPRTLLDALAQRDRVQNEIPDVTMRQLYETWRTQHLDMRHGAFLVQ